MMTINRYHELTLTLASNGENYVKNTMSIIIIVDKLAESRFENRYNFSDLSVIHQDDY